MQIINEMSSNYSCVVLSALNQAFSDLSKQMRVESNKTKHVWSQSLVTSVTGCLLLIIALFKLRENECTRIVKKVTL